MSELPSVTDVVRNFSDYINRVVYHGERFVLTRGGKVVAELRPALGGRTLADLPGVVAGLPELSRSEMDRLERDLRRARRDGSPDAGSGVVREAWIP